MCNTQGKNADAAQTEPTVVTITHRNGHTVTVQAHLDLDVISAKALEIFAATERGPIGFGVTLSPQPAPAPRVPAA